MSTSLIQYESNFRVMIFSTSISTPAKNLSESWVHFGRCLQHSLWSSVKHYPSEMKEASPAQSSMNVAVQGGKYCGSRQVASWLTGSQIGAAALLHMLTPTWCSCLWAQKSGRSSEKQAGIYMFLIYVFCFVFHVFLLFCFYDVIL